MADAEPGALNAIQNPPLSFTSPLVVEETEAQRG